MAAEPVDRHLLHRHPHRRRRRHGRMPRRRRRRPTTSPSASTSSSRGWTPRRKARFLQVAIAASFETHCSEHGVSRAAQREGIAPRQQPPSPAAMLHQEMVRGRAERRQAIAYSIARRARASASKEATGSEAGPSSAQLTPPRDDDHLF
jgi:hypothetical protein